MGSNLCTGMKVNGDKCTNPVSPGQGTCGKCKGAADGPSMTATSSDAASAVASDDPFASLDLPAPSKENAQLAVVDYGQANADSLPSVRKARWDARADLANGIADLEGRKGMTKQEQVDSLRAASQKALNASLELERAAQHAEKRDLDGWQAKKMAQGDGSVPSISGDSEFVGQQNVKDDMVGWAIGQQMDESDMDQGLQQLMDEDGGDNDTPA